MIYIYQILGNMKSYHTNIFAIKDSDEKNDLDIENTFESLLSSIFIYKNLKNREGKKIIFLKPISLGLDNKMIDSYLQKYITSKDYEIVDMPAYGMYKDKIYDYYPNEILLSIFIDMIKRINIDDEIFIDINTGLNEYVTLLIAAASYLIVALSLKNIKEEKTLNIYQIISDPMVEKTKNYTSLFIQKLNRKIFFSLPYSNEMKISSLIYASSDNKRIFENKFDYKKDYKEIIENLTIIFNAIRFNTLPFISNLKNSISDDKNLLPEIIDEIIRNFKDVLIYNDKREIKVKNVYELINFIMALEFYQGLIELLEDKLNDIANLDMLGNIAEKIYKNQFINLPANYEFLKRDIDNYENDLNDYKGKNTKSNNKRGSGKRNFFAHSGMDINSYKICNKRIIYCPEKIEERKKWLLKP